MATRAPIEAFARLKPPARQAHSVLYSIEKGDQQLNIHLPKDYRRGTIANNAKETYPFHFSGVFREDATQEEVFERVAGPVVDTCLQGYNGTIFAYG